MTMENDGLRRVVKLLFRWKGLRVLGHLVRRMHYRNECRQISDFDDDLKFNCYLNEHIGSLMYWRGSYSTTQLAVLDRLMRDGMVFVDIGANQGEFSIFAAKRTPSGRVFCFEPMSSMYARLVENIRLNGFRNIEAVRTGLWSENSSARLYISPQRFDDGSVNEGLGTLFQTESRSMAVESVSLQSLDFFVEERGIERIDVIKVDAEGAEFEILRGARATLEKFRPFVFLEINRTNATAAGRQMGDLIDYLSQWYEFELILPHGRTRPLEVRGLAEHQDVLCRPR